MILVRWMRRIYSQPARTFVPSRQDLPPHTYRLRQKRRWVMTDSHRLNNRLEVGPLKTAGVPDILPPSTDRDEKPAETPFDFPASCLANFQCLPARRSLPINASDPANFRNRSGSTEWVLAPIKSGVELIHITASRA